MAQRVLVEHLDQHLRKPADTGLIIGIAEIDNLAVAFPSFVFNDPEESFDPVADICKASFLVSTINQLDGRALDKIQDELRDRPRTADPC